jgi:protein KRI1
MDHSSRRVPTYNEITNLSSKSSKRKSTRSQPNPDLDGSGEESEGAEQGGEGGGQVGTLSDEEAFDDLADAFETSYNFRFEEP